MKRTFFTCDCGSAEHFFSVSQDDEFVFVEVFLAQKPFFKRLKRALGYVLGRRSIYGDFDEVLLNKEDTKRLGELLLETANDQNYEPPHPIS